MIIFRSKKTALISAVFTLIMLVAVGKSDGKEFTWRMHVTYPLGLPISGEGIERFEHLVAKNTQGTLQIEAHEPGALVPAYEYIDSVSIGAIDAAWGALGQLVGREPALAFFSAVPFGPRFTEFIAWIDYGGGQELAEEIFLDYNIHPMFCHASSPEAGGWYRKEIKSLDDCKGMKMRVFGPGADVLQKFGADPQLIPGSEIYLALELGLIETTEYGSPVTDESFGFDQIAKHYYLPGWHAQTTLNALLINKDAYEALSDHQRTVLETTCRYNLLATFVHYESAQGAALKSLKEKGVNVHKWPRDMLAKFKKAWLEVAEAEAVKDVNYRKVWDSLRAFRAEYSHWGESGYLDSYNLE